MDTRGSVIRGLPNAQTPDRCAGVLCYSSPRRLSPVVPPEDGSGSSMRKAH